MFILSEAIELITQSPGNLVYFLVTLFALQQALFAALGARRPVPASSTARRWIWATGGILLGRVVLIVLGLLGIAGLLSPLSILPSLERWILFGTILSLGWAGILGVRAQRWQTWTLVALLLLSLLAFGYSSTIQAPPDQLLPLPDSAFWEQVAVVGALVLVLFLTVVTRPVEWEWAVGILLFWGAGTVAQLQWGNPALPLDGWQRLASLVALPLMSLMVQRQVLRAGVAAPSPAPLTNSILLTDILQSVEGARDLHSTLILVSSRLAGLLDVNVCCLALALDDTPDDVQVVAIHPPTSVQIDPPRLKLADYPGLKEATTNGQVVVANSVSRAAWLFQLYAALGFLKPEPLLTLPLLHQGKALGLLMLGGPRDRKAWQPVDEAGAAYDDVLLVSELLAGSMSVARTKKTERERVSKPALPEIQEHDTERHKLAEMVEQAKKQILALNGRIRVLIQEIKVRDEEILALNNELESRSQAVSSTELEVWQGEVRQLAEDRNVLERKLQDVTQDRDVLLEERARLGQKMAAAKQRLEQVEEHRERLEEEVAELQGRLRSSETPVAATAIQAGHAMGDIGASHNGGGVGLMVADTSGHITMANALARKMLRLPGGDVIGVPLNGAYPDVAWTQTVDDLLGSEGDRSRAHLSLAMETGSVEADMAALFGRNGEVDGLVVTLHSAEGAAEQRESIVSLASDFRTPMTAITGYTDLLLGEQAGILTDMQQQFLVRVKANVEQLNHLLNDLIQVVSPDSRRVELTPQPVNLIEIIELAIMGLAARFRERRLAVDLDLSSELSPIQADRDSLYQIILRLLSNAVLCSREGTQVVVTAREEASTDSGRHFRISVTDTGGGIAPEDYPRVFRRLYRARQPLVEGMGETGIGMAVARALVEANGGRIWVESIKGEGSTFCFLLPVNP